MDKKVLNYLSNMYTPEKQDEEMNNIEEVVMDDGQIVLAEATDIFGEEKIKVDVTLMQEYMNYLSEDTSELLTFQEWIFLEKRRWDGKKRDFENKFGKFMLYGLVFFATGPIAPIIGPLLLWLYRRSTDDCINKCSGQSGGPCYNKCYYEACDDVIKRINKELGQVNKIENERKRKSVEKKLRKERVKWVEKQKKYKRRM